MPEAASDRLVFASCRPPYPLDNGGRIRTHRLLTGLAQSFEIVFVTFEFAPGDPDGYYVQEELQELLPEVTVLSVPHGRRYKRLNQAVTLARRESWTLGRYHAQAYTDALARAVASHRPGVAHFDDLAVVPVAPFAGVLNVYSAHNIERDILRHESRVGSPPRRVFNRVEAAKVSREEQRIWRAMDLCLAVSALDGAAMRAGGARKVEICPNGVDPVARLPLRPLRPGEPLRLLFVGSGDYAPYERGIAWVVREVLPRLRASVAVEFDVVGTPPARPLAGDGVRYVGNVPTVEPYYDAAHVVLVPVFEGSGTRLKMIEAAAFGRPVVSTLLGAEGLPLAADVDFLAADGAEEFAAAVLTLARLWHEPFATGLERMLEGAREAVLSLSWPRVVDRLATLYRSQLGERAATRPRAAHDGTSASEREPRR